MKLFICIEEEEHYFWIDDEAEEEMLTGIGHLSCPWCDSLCTKSPNQSITEREKRK